MGTLIIEKRRVYDVVDQAAPATDYRVLADRLWPRGIKKERLDYREWDRDITPSTELRRALHAGSLSWDAFAAQYTAELEASGEPAALLERFRDSGAERLVLLTSAKNSPSHLDVLADHLQALASS
ncbi:DUF488 domain-containing protein [Neoactinobaculum massilliense]|uniref:DUF488 domain-containing protein n=1 Tax=Neoactinobaculum massilliense TaxID=2364794 RepID=UPI0019CFCFCF|nr:DUF488 family protein [Neoactinobaculum massilliense]